MKMNPYAVVLASSLLCISSFVYAEAKETVVTYKNLRGSIMKLNWSPSKDKVGTVSGTFKTAVSKCAAAKRDVPVSGVYNGNALALTASFPGCSTVVAMSGNVSADRNEMHLQWLVTKEAESSLHESWDVTTTGVDHYKKQP
jgi:hypothetical protein